MRRADALLALRPDVYPGTRVIISDKFRTAWYDMVSRAMFRLGFLDGPRDAAVIAEFCDRAGVPD
jgi:hypothetical protein